MQKTIPEGEIRVGVLGAFRGKSFADTAAASGMKLVAICDNFRHRLDEVCGELKVPGYEDFDEVIRQDFDAVVIAAPFHPHAYFAMRALKAGKHVLSETSCNITLVAFFILRILLIRHFLSEKHFLESFHMRTF